MLSYPATIPLSSRTLNHVAGLSLIVKTVIELHGRDRQLISAHH